MIDILWDQSGSIRDEVPGEIVKGLGRCRGTDYIPMATSSFSILPARSGEEPRIILITDGEA